MRAGWLLTLLLIGCAGPLLVPSPQPDGGPVVTEVDGGPSPRLVKVLYAYEVELGEAAALAAFVEAHSTGQDPEGVQLEFAVVAYGMQGTALVTPFVGRQALGAVMQREQPLVLTDVAPGVPGQFGPTQVRASTGVLMEVVLADVRRLSADDRDRVEYRLITVMSGDAYVGACQACSLGEQTCCVNETIASMRKVRSFVELWDADRVTLQPVRVNDASLGDLARYLLESMAQEGGTGLIETTLPALRSTLSSIDLLRRAP